MDAFAPLDPKAVPAGTAAGKAKPTKVPIIPVPDDAPPLKFRHPKYGEPIRTWPYHVAEGLACHVARFEFTNEDGSAGKEILPLTFCDLGNGRRAWRAKGIPDPRPLYRLRELLARPDVTVLICEGEKAVDAAAALFPEFIASTPMNGAKAPHKTDWGPAKGRHVTIWPDNDEPGAAFADQVTQLATAAGAASVRVVAVPKEWPEGWDLADPAPEGADLGAMLDSAMPWQPAPATDDADDDHQPTSFEHFQLGHDGVRKRVVREDKATGRRVTEWVLICSRLEVLAETRTEDGEEWGRLLRVTDRDGKIKDWAMPMAMLAGDGQEYRAKLLSLGLIIPPGRFARDALHEYISTAWTNLKARCVGRVGWHGRTFVLPDATIGDAAGEMTLLQTAGSLDHAFRVNGILESWQEQVARQAVGNSRLILALSAAFAAPLLHLTGAESGGIHFRGSSSIGKSSALLVAGSVWGGGGIKGFVRQWRLTDSALESIAATHSDTLLCLDEVAQADPTKIGPIAYMLANGAGKARAGRSGEVRSVAEWRCLFLSSGEISLADKMLEDGKVRRSTAGQQVRVLDIPADAGAGLGLFETLHNFPNADAFARHLKTATLKHYGAAARAFLAAITKAPEDVTEAVGRYSREFMEKSCPAGADGQVSRAGARFALIAAAGELATSLGIVPWPAGEATAAAARCFRDWIGERGGTAASEETAAVSAVRHFIEAHGTSRFEPMGNLIPTDNSGAPLLIKTVNRAGFRFSTETGNCEYYILPEVWKNEVCAGMDAKAAARTLVKRGMLTPDTQGRSSISRRLPGIEGTPRVYHLTSKIFSDD